MTKKKPKTKKTENAEGIMTVSGHLRELRNRIAVILITFVVAVAVFLAIAPMLVTFFTDMGTRYGYEFVFIAPQELLMQRFRVAIVGALIVSSPVILFEVFGFARPGLTESESATLKAALTLGLLFFAIGVLFAYFVAIPFMLDFLIGLKSDNDYIRESISVASYLDFVLLLFTIFGAMFEMPLISVVLSRFGLLTPNMLNKARPVAVILIFIMAAVITPPDIASQILVAVPMILLYLLSTLLSRIFYRKRKQKQAEEEADSSEEEE